jgi:hypothetical protein
MIDKQIFHNIAEKNFGVFSICTEDDIDFLRSIYKEKDNIRKNIKNMIMGDDGLKSKTRVEIYSLLTEFLFDKCPGIQNIEVCAIYSIFWDTLRLSFKKNSKRAIFENFKRGVIKHSMDRPPLQIGILAKQTVEKLTTFFVDTIFSRFEHFKYMLSKNKEVEIVNKDMFEISLPHILNLEMAIEALPRNLKILKQYTENRKPKSDLEKKIEIILDFERERLDLKLDDKFSKQDKVFNTKVDDLISKKKK